MMHVVHINSFGHYVPERILDNQELQAVVDTSDEWIRNRTGIVERRIAAPHQTCSDLAMEAARKALAAAGMEPEALTHIVVATVTGDAAFPSTACRLQSKLGVSNCMAMDVGAACSGFLFGLQTARGLLAAEPAAKVLLVGAEVLSRRIDWQDRSTCVLFGDGAGAVILSNTPAPGNMLQACAIQAVTEGVRCGGDGRLGDLLYCNGGGSEVPYTRGDVVGSEYFLQMNGREVFKHAVRAMSNISLGLLAELGYTIQDIDIVIPHQANARIVNAVAERLGLPRDKIFVNLDKYGNTSAASIPLALSESVEQGIVRPGMRILLTAFGAGFTWGAAVLRF